MEIVISLLLGIWIAASGVICYLHYNSDERRQKDE